MHWVHSTPETPTEWSLQMLLLAFREVRVITVVKTLPTW
jgi:hypothetical protein